MIFGDDDDDTSPSSVDTGGDEDALMRGDVLSTDVKALKDGDAQTVAAKAAADDAAKLAALQNGEVPAEKTPDSKLEEGEETPEEKAEREAAEEAQRKQDNIRIPKKRVDEMVGKANAKAEAALQELAQVKAQLQALQTKPTENELETLRKSIDDLKDKYEEHMLDGRKAEAQAVRKELDAKQDELIERRIALNAHQAQEGVIAKLTYEAELAKMEAKYPQINPDSENHDPELEKELGDLMTIYIKSGFSAIEALHKAARYVMPKAAPAQAAAKPNAAEERARQAKAKAAEAAKKQPTDITEVGKDSDKAGGGTGGKLDVMRMSQKQFAALDDDTIRKNRGDDLE